MWALAARHRCLLLSPCEPHLMLYPATQSHIYSLVLRQGDDSGCRASHTGQGKAQSAGNGMPFPRSATQHWPVWGAPFGPVRKRSSAVLRSLELAMASPAVARLAANRFLTGCIPSYHLDGVLMAGSIVMYGHFQRFQTRLPRASTLSRVRSFPTVSTLPCARNP